MLEYLSVEDKGKLLKTAVGTSFIFFVCALVFGLSVFFVFQSISIGENAEAKVTSTRSRYFGVFKEINYTYLYQGHYDSGVVLILSMQSFAKKGDVFKIKVLPFPRVKAFVGFVYQQIFGSIALSILSLGFGLYLIFWYFRNRPSLLKSSMQTPIRTEHR